MTPAIDGSKVLPFDRLKAELFYPEREENIATTNTVPKMAVEIADCLIAELTDPKKATHMYLTATEGEFSWGYTCEADHATYVGKHATNDSAESPFAALTRQLQAFGRILGSHAAGIAQARFNGDFKRDIGDPSLDGAYHMLSPEMRTSLLEFALKKSPQVRKAEKAALEKQRAAKKKKQDKLKEMKLEAATAEYVKTLTYLEMFHSPACWKTAKDVRQRFGKLGSETAKRNAVKEQIRIRVLGLQWKDLHTPWSKDGVDFTAEQLRDILIEKIIPEQRERKILDVPSVDLPSRGERAQLGTRSIDLDNLDAKRKDKESLVIEKALEMKADLDTDGCLQPDMPGVNDDCRASLGIY